MRCGFDPWVRKIPWRRKWQLTPAWRIPWTEEPGGLQSMRLQRVRYDWAQNPATTWERVKEMDISQVFKMGNWASAQLQLQLSFSSVSKGTFLSGSVPRGGSCAPDWGLTDHPLFVPTPPSPSICSVSPWHAAWPLRGCAQGFPWWPSG